MPDGLRIQLGLLEEQALLTIFLALFKSKDNIYRAEHQGSFLSAFVCTCEHYGTHALVGVRGTTYSTWLFLPHGSQVLAWQQVPVAAEP